MQSFVTAISRATVSLALLVFVLLLNASVWGQGGSGSITGIVTDPAGAVVQGATIKALSNSTGTVRTAESNASGNYNLASLAPGSYTITAEKTGFRTVEFANVQVSTSLAVPLDVQLQVGAPQESVTVTAETLAPIETQDTQVSNLVDSQRMVALPLITRNPYELVLLSPGAAQSNSSLGGFHVNGERERNNNFLLDGVDNNDTSVPGIAGGALNANPDSTEEFRVITNNFNAEYGRDTGAIVDVVTKSGTNNFHGDAYWFGRYNKIGGARDWFNRASEGPQDPYDRNQFGYSIGGPIWKDKTFFFFNQEFQRFRTSTRGTTVVPTAAFKSGVFTFNGTDDNGNPITRNIDLTPGSPDNQAFATNTDFFGTGTTQLPADPTMQAIFALYPNPTTLTGDGYTGLLSFPNDSNQKSYQATAKIDHRFTNSESFSFRFGYNDLKDPNPFASADLANNLGAISEKAITTGGAAKLTSTFSSNLVNEVSFGWNHIFAGFGCVGHDVLDSVFPVDKFGNGAEFTMNPFQSWACGNGSLLSDGQARETGTISPSDNLTWVKGAHTLKFGGDFRNVRESGYDNFNSRRQIDTRLATAFGGFDALGIGVSDPSLNDAIAAYFGFVVSDLNAEFFDHSGTRQATDNKDFVQRESDYYAQDTWKVYRNFTVNLGLRYGFNSVPKELHGNISNLFTDPRSFPVIFTNTGEGTGRQLYANDYSNIEPRVGFSWDPWKDGKTAVRGGFGIFHDRVFGNLFGNSRGNPPFEQDYSNGFVADTINNGYGTGNFPTTVPQTQPSASVPDGSLLAPTIIDPHFRNPVTNSWFFGIQHELPASVVVDVGYVGHSSHHTFRVFDANPPDPALVAQLVAYCSVPNAFNCTPATVSSLSLYFGKEAGVLPFNGVAHNAIGRAAFAAALNESNGNANYNGLQAKVTKRFTHGYQIQGAYTWSHSIDDGNDPLVDGLGQVGFVRDPLNPELDRGNSDHDIRHVGVINSIWELPFGTGSTYANTGVVGRLLEGFQLSGILTLQTGRPFDVLGTRDPLRVGRVNRADLVGNPFSGGGTFTPGTKVFFTNNTTAFANPPFDTVPTIGRNFFHGPSFVNLDMAVSKRITIWEKVGIDLRLEAYNVLNHPNFSVPGSDNGLTGNVIGTALFGQITKQVGRPDATTGARQLQVAAKFSF